MKNVLMICYTWPPAADVGILRSLAFAKYLRRFGWNPVILTPQYHTLSENIKNIDDIQVVRTKYFDLLERIRRLGRFNNAELLKKNLSTGDNVLFNNRQNTIGSSVKKFFREFVSIPDEQIGWFPFAVGAGLKIIKEHQCSVIFSTSPPETSHLIARTLQRRTRLSWIADLRDPWADYHQANKGRIKKKLDEVIEKRVLKYPDLISTVSLPWVEYLKERLKCSSGTVHYIPNGFDADDFNGSAVKDQEKFTITYTGKLHKENQNPALFFEIISDLIRDGLIDKKNITVRFYTFGYFSPDFENMKKIYGLEKVVEVYGRVDYITSIKKQRESALLLIIDWKGHPIVRKGVVPVKFYEYLGSKKPIMLLSYGEKTALTDLIEKTGSGVVFTNKTQGKEAVLKYYREFMERQIVTYSGKIEEINKFTRKNTTKKLASLFDMVAACGSKQGKMVL